jgi:hypothetical protein
MRWARGFGKKHHVQKMSQSVELTLGEVRRPTDRDDLEYRVLAIDREEVLCDASYFAFPRWVYSEARGKCFYSHDSVVRLLRSSTHVRHQPLTDDERARFRPDLPIFFLETPAVSWGFAAGCDRAAFPARMKSLGLDVESMPGLAVPEVMLYAARLRASSKGVLCRAENGRSFSATELLWHGHQIQETRGYLCGPGLGFFRLGHERNRVPSFLACGCNESRVPHYPLSA